MPLSTDSPAASARPVWDHPDGDQDQVRGHQARVSLDAGDMAVPAEDSADPGVGAEVDTVLAVQSGEVLTQPLAVYPGERHGGGLEHRDLTGGEPSGGGDLQADPTRPDDHQSVSGHECIA
jgi:hypothetical protein